MRHLYDKQSTRWQSIKMTDFNPDLLLKSPFVQPWNPYSRPEWFKMLSDHIAYWSLGDFHYIDDLNAALKSVVQLQSSSFRRRPQQQQPETGVRSSACLFGLYDPETSCGVIWRKHLVSTHSLPHPTHETQSPSLGARYLCFLRK